MYRKDIDEEDLRSEIFSLRKHIARVCSENQILKVKIRRLQDEMITRDKQLDEFLNSKRVNKKNASIFGFTKDLQEKGVSVLLNLKLKNDKLEQSILEKDLLIKRLQNTLQTAKLYNANSFSKKFSSKGVECTLITDNKSECQKKGKVNKKIELRMPSFDMNRLNEIEENLKSEELIRNFDLDQEMEHPYYSETKHRAPSYYSETKQKTTPSYYSEARYSSKSASYQLGRRDSQSSYIIEKCEISRSNLHIGLPVEEDNRSDKPRNALKHTYEKGHLNPSFKTIAHSVERLMSQDSIGVTIQDKILEDKSMQFSAERFDKGQSATVQVVEQNTEANDSFMDLIHNPKFRRDVETFEQRFPPTMLREMQIQDQSDLEATSISEKTDKMEKTEIYVDQKGQQITDSEAPHEEIKQLHVFVMDMISQVDSLKSSISKMKVDQQKTENDLKSRDENIDKLAREIEQLRKMKSLSIIGFNKFSDKAASNMEPAEKDTDELNMCESLQKATENNLKKIAGKIKDLKASKSKTSFQLLEKSSKISSKRSKIEKRNNDEKSNLKNLEKKTVKSSETKNVFGIGSGDVVEVPFFRCGFRQTSLASEKTEFDELD